MGARWTDWPAEILATLRRGAVIPAHPLALDADRALDAVHQLVQRYVFAATDESVQGWKQTEFGAEAEGGLQALSKFILYDVACA